MLAQGDVWQHALLIERGLLRLHFVRPDGREFNKNFYGDGALICPLTEAMWGAPSLFAITAVESGRLWIAEASPWRAALDAAGAWAPLRTELLARLVTHKLQREHDLLAFDGRRRYEDFCERMPTLADRIALRHLATYLGLTDVQLSRIRRAQRN
ncbi:MAG: Crp/Fnr family transcriptional regulator [Burkholderiaceae bacterium]